MFRGLAKSQWDYEMCRFVDEKFDKGHMAPNINDLHEAGRKANYYGASDSLLTLMADRASTSKAAKAKGAIHEDMWVDVCDTTLNEYVRKKAAAPNTSYRCVGKSGPTGSGFHDVKAVSYTHLTLPTKRIV